MLNITFAQAWRKFGLEAEKRCPSHVTQEYKTILKANCVLGLARLSGFYVEDESEITSKMASLESQGNLTVSALIG